MHFLFGVAIGILAAWVLYQLFKPEPWDRSRRHWTEKWWDK